MLLLTVSDTDLKEVFEEEQIMRDKCHVICLSNRRHIEEIPIHCTEGDTKKRFLGRNKIFITINNIKISRIHPSLFQTKLILDGTKDSVIPLQECLPVFKSVVNVGEALIAGVDEEESSDQMFSQSEIKR